jgi:hypothetical protein
MEVYGKRLAGHATKAGKFRIERIVSKAKGTFHWTRPEGICAYLIATADPVQPVDGVLGYEPDHLTRAPFSPRSGAGEIGVPQFASDVSVLDMQKSGSYRSGNVL